VYITALDPAGGQTPVNIDQGDVNPPPRQPPPGKVFTPVPAKYQSPETSGLTFVVKAGPNTFDVDMK
jgi:hypothetical protein